MKYTNEDLIGKFAKESKNMGKAENSIKTYVKNIRLMLEETDMYCLDVTNMDMIDYISDLKDKDFVQNTVRQKCISLNLFFRFCHEKGLMTEIVKLKTGNDKDEKKRIDAEPRISPLLMSTILEVNNAYYDENPTNRNVKEKAILNLLAYGGLRRSEVRALKHNNVYLTDTEHQRTRVDIIDSKHDKSRTIFLDKKVYYMIQDWVYVKKSLGLKSEYIFCTTNNKRMSETENTTYKMAMRWSKRADAKVDGEEYGFAPHQYRHAVGSIMADNGIPSYKIADFLGNSKEVAEKTYIHINKESMQDVCNVINY